MYKLTQNSSIAGNWISPTGEAFQAQNPATQELLAEHKNCLESDVNSAMKAAQQAFPAFSQLSPADHANFLIAIAEEIEALGDQLLEVCNQETGLGLPRLTGERGRTTGQIKAFAEIVKNASWVQASIDTAEPERAPLPKPDLRKILKPIGPVAVFGASNFPFAFGTLGGDTISALAAGNPVVVKGHPSHPATNELFAYAIGKAISRCELPQGVFSLLQGNTIPLSVQLVCHPLTEAVGFTGSLSGGRAIMDAAAKRAKPIPVFAEMGSVNPMFFTNNVLAQSGESLAKALADSVCMGTGQFCTSPGVIVIQKNDSFVNTLAESMSANAKGTMLNAGIGQAFLKGIEQLIATGEVEWVNQAQENLESSINNALQPPNVVLKTSAQAFLQNTQLQHEVFGPATLVVECDDDAQFAQIASAFEGNLTATIHATDKDTYLVKQLVTLLEQKVGRIIFNGFPTGVEVCGSQQHGGPYPASSNASTTSVGIDAIHRFTRVVAYQNTPEQLLPAELQNVNPYKIVRRVNGEFSSQSI
ncbi:aldehyde dehydrogenase (NADP(+)) [Pseudocolwellia sp. HL-MZ19]|uniref:aldehyde dehydrogenase (NADP(+)) n=1 Tax=Pseudocolwellia sp. HL-MZ19 TaxID=3400846 RepID=UPI003CF98461